MLPFGKEETEKLLGTKCEKPKGALFPVWFLTWRNKDRVAYAIVNGETGKVSADIPIDYWKYIFGTGIVAAILFAIMSLIFTMTSVSMLKVACAIALFAQIVYYYELRQIEHRENHIFDKGYFAAISDELAKRRQEKFEAKSRKSKKELKYINTKGGIIFSAILNIIFIAICTGLASIGVSMILALMYFLIGTFYPLALIVSLIFLVLSIKEVFMIKEKTMVIPPFLCFAGVGLGLYMSLTKVIEDWYYYGAAIICLIGVLLTCISLIKRHNLLATRPLPNFFDRKGGDDSAK